MPSTPPLRLRRIRESQGKSLRSVARAADIDCAALSLIERGLRQPRVDTLAKICRALNLVAEESLLEALAPTNGKPKR